MTPRPLIALCLALLMVLTGQAVAVARGQPGAEGWAEICSGTGPVMVAVDAKGQPVGPAHLCPDDAALLLQAIPAAALDAVPARTAHRIAFPPDIRSSHNPAPLSPAARGPPVAL